MIRSHQPFSAHANEFFKFRLSEQKLPLPEPHEETHSIHSGADDESVSSISECYDENRSQSISSNEDRPLNLSCKKRKVECEDLQEPERKLSTEFPKSSNKPLVMPVHSVLPHTVLEQAAMLQYQAQVLASNDILRALAHKRWEESIALQQPLLSPASFSSSFHPWLAANALSNYQQLLYPPSPTNGLLGNPLTGKIPDEARRSPQQQRFSDSLSVASSAPLQPTSSPSINSAASGSPMSNSASIIASKSPLMAFPAPAPETSLSNPTNVPGDVAALSPKICSPLPPNPILPSSGVDSRKRKRSKRSDDKGGEKDSYPCSICGASYPHKFELNRHIKVSHVRPHRCTQCGKGFGHRNYLKVHIETVHLGQKSHQCRLCGKYLSTGGNLNVHVRTIHFGEKKYNCPVCNRSFGQQCNMKTHMKRHYSKSE